MVVEWTGKTRRIEVIDKQEQEQVEQQGGSWRMEQRVRKRNTTTNTLASSGGSKGVGGRRSSGSSVGYAVWHKGGEGGVEQRTGSAFREYL